MCLNASVGAADWHKITAAGDVVGPGSATDNAVVRFDLTTGKLIQDSSVIIDDSGNVSGVVNFTTTGYAQLADIAAPSNPSDGQGRLYKKTGDDGLFWLPDSGGAEVDLTASGSGDVSGPASSTNNAVATFDGTGGKTIQESPAIIDGSGNLSGVVNLTTTGYAELSDMSAPANPGLGKGRFYKKTGDDGVFWKPDVLGPEVDLTGATTLQGNDVASGVPANADIWVFSGGSSEWQHLSMSGDATIDSTASVTVTGIRGTAVNTGSPNNRNILQYNSSSGEWEYEQISGDATLNAGGNLTVSGIRGDTVQDIGTPSDGDGLVWDSANSHYAITKVQTKQKLVFNERLRLDETSTDDTYYGRTGLNDSAPASPQKPYFSDKSYGYNGTSPGGLPELSTNYPHAAGVVVPESGTIKKVSWSLVCPNTSTTSDIEFNTLIITPDYDGGGDTSQVNVSTSAQTYDPSAEGYAVSKTQTLNNTSVVEGDIIVPVMSATNASDAAASGDPHAQIVITIEVNA